MAIVLWVLMSTGLESLIYEMLGYQDFSGYLTSVSNHKELKRAFEVR